MSLPRRKLLQLAAGATAVPFASRITSGQAYPMRPIRFIVPYPPGGATDVAARVIGEYLSRSLGQQIIVENKSGGGSLIGVESAAKSSPCTPRSTGCAGSFEDCPYPGMSHR